MGRCPSTRRKIGFKGGHRSEGFIGDYYLPAESKADKTTPLSSFSTDYRDWH